jgi:hypothetical protein
LLPTANGALSHGYEVFVENSVVSSDTTMWAFRQIMSDPRFQNVIKLASAKTDEVSGAGESHPRALTEPDVHVSTHQAPISRKRSRYYPKLPVWKQKRFTASDTAQPMGCPSLMSAKSLVFPLCPANKVAVDALE